MSGPVIVIKDDLLCHSESLLSITLFQMVYNNSPLSIYPVKTQENAKEVFKKHAEDGSFCVALGIEVDGIPSMFGQNFGKEVIQLLIEYLNKLIDRDVINPNVKTKTWDLVYYMYVTCNQIHLITIFHQSTMNSGLFISQKNIPLVVKEIHNSISGNLIKLFEYATQIHLKESITSVIKDQKTGSIVEIPCKVRFSDTKTLLILLNVCKHSGKTMVIFNYQDYRGLVMFDNRKILSATKIFMVNDFKVALFDNMSDLNLAITSNATNFLWKPPKSSVPPPALPMPSVPR